MSSDASYRSRANSNSSCMYGAVDVSERSSSRTQSGEQ